MCVLYEWLIFCCLAIKAIYFISGKAKQAFLKKIQHIDKEHFKVHLHLLAVSQCVSRNLEKVV